ncbi:hypothetical protein IW140_006471 [Coemansia sp. RSA 1813]|nr:hypothetical protein IW140_006471 [Coemansia sp. RSA 1813]
MERKREAKEAAQKTIVDQNVPDVAIPRNEGARSRADEISGLVVSAFESYVNLAPYHTRLATQTSSGLAAMQSEKPDPSIDIGVFSDECKGIREMIRGKGRGRGKGKAKAAHERDMYPWVKALFSLIAEAICEADRILTKPPTAARPSVRQIVPFKHTDRTPEGADDQDRIDIALRVEGDTSSDSPYRGSMKPDYSKMLALIEAKCSSDEPEQQAAYAQLFKYSRHIYANQHDRRFVWGLTVCDSTFRICLLGQNRILSSGSIDVTTPDGRKALAKWLVNMSLCERDRLGYDPTLYYNGEENRWEIKVHDDATGEFKVYEIISCMRISDRVCGRHTRCFRCKETEASGDVDEHGKAAKPREILVKRAWAIAAQNSDDKSRDEVSLLREINNTLKDNKDLEGKYPTLLAGGVVRITDENGEMFDDTVKTAFAELSEETLRDVGSRTQKGMAMTPIGQDIRRCKSADELIIAAADVMEVHSAIRKQCNILHRDISINNILINRNGPGGGACGMLIDFDCALRIDDTTDHKARSEMTGTFPFMSINNLEASDVIRTELDDWESIIYVLCWLGTFGVNADDEKAHERPDNDFDSLNIEKWRIGTGKAVAKAKRIDMDTNKLFVSNIVSQIIKNPSYFHLKHLAVSLRGRLFDNTRVSPKGRGALETNEDDLAFQFAAIPEQSTKGPYWDDGCDKDELDQFKRRATCAGKISDALLEAIKDARKGACERIASSVEAVTS